MHGTHLLVLFFIPTKYYQNMSLSIRYGAHKDVSMDFCFRGDNSIMKKARVIIPPAYVVCM